VSQEPPPLLLPEPVELPPLPPLPPVMVVWHCAWQLTVEQLLVLCAQLVQLGLMPWVHCSSQFTSPWLHAQKHWKYPLHAPVTHVASAGQLPSTHDQHASLMVAGLHEGPR